MGKEATIDVTDASILAWIVGKKIRNEKGEVLDFSDRLFLLDILKDWGNEIVIKKCSQVGGSVIFNLKILFAALKFDWSIIYTFPSQDDAQEFVKSKTNKIISANRHVFGSLDSDSVEQKHIGNAEIFFKGLNSETSSIMTTAQLLVHDEASRSNQMAMTSMESRTKGVEKSKRYRWMFSNPTTEKDIIAEKWEESDKKEWHVTCTVCNTEQPMKWPDNIEILKKIFQCASCKAVLSDEQRRKGKWKATNPDKTISGYHISHLICPWITAEEIIKDSEKDQEYFHNFVLGESYNPGDLRIDRGTIIDNWTPRDLKTGNWFLGVDVGNIKHYALGSERGIIKVGKFTDWDVLDKLMKTYDPVLVIDAMPENTMSKHFVKNYRKAFMCYLNRDRKRESVVKWGEGEEKGIIHADRNRLMDQVIDELLNAKILYNVPSDGSFREYLDQCETLRRIKEVDSLGIERYCFVAGTKILTDHGEKNIETIKTGDRVLTRNGYKLVAHTMNREAEVVDMGVLCGTPDHPVFTNRGVKGLLSIPLFDKVYTCQPKQFSTRVLGLLDTLMQRVLQIETTFALLPCKQEKTVLRDYIKRSTRITLAIFQKGLSYITKTTIRLIIRQKTWAFCIKKNITNCTSQNTYPILHGQKEGLSRQEKRCSADSKHGKEPTKQKSSSANTARKTSPPKSRFISLVSGAEKNARPSTKEGENTVAYHVERNGTQSIIGIRYGKEKVYNLTIEDTPEYFANGVLVHNCWESTNGNDHFFFATLFYHLACLSSGNGAVFNSDKPKILPIVSTMSGFRMNIEEYLEEKYGGD